MITAVVLAHNDERSIARTLESLDFCDERIVIDDDSADKTVEIAKNLKARVYTRSLSGDFAAQRNFGLSKANGDWVLFVDSDEVVTDELANEIQKIGAPSEQTRNDNAGYYIKRSDILWGRELRYGETANVRLLRLAKKPAGSWERTVHEVWRVSGTIGELHFPLLHYPHPDVAQFIAEINQYSTLNAKYYYEQGIRTNAVQIVLYPMVKFFVNYLWRLGFLDGTPGILVALFMSFHSFLTRAKLYILQNQKT